MQPDGNIYATMTPDHLASTLFYAHSSLMSASRARYEQYLRRCVFFAAVISGKFHFNQ